MDGFQADEQMGVIGHAADAFGKTAQSANRSAKIIVETCPPFRGDKRLTILRGEHEVVVQAQVGRGHGVSGLASLRDAVGLGTVIRWYRRSAPQPLANGFEPSGFAMTQPGAIRRIGFVSSQSGGMPAISRGVSVAPARHPFWNLVIEIYHARSAISRRVCNRWFLN